MKKLRWLGIILSLSVSACSAHLPLTTVPRLDTQNIMGYRFKNSTITEYTKATILAALPSETALCYTGFIQDTTVFIKKFMNPLDSTKVIRQLVIITGVKKANIKDAGSSYVAYHDDIACDYTSDLVAVAHSHLNMTRYSRCDHSDRDAIFMHDKRAKYVLSFVWCPHALGILWADGRRW